VVAPSPTFTGAETPDTILNSPGLISPPSLDPVPVPPRPQWHKKTLYNWISRLCTTRGGTVLPISFGGFLNLF
jgi:hypothetical protein